LFVALSQDHIARCGGQCPHSLAASISLMIAMTMIGGIVLLIANAIEQFEVRHV
jgi:hypothetical protein